jgi:hypothetical protein
MIALLLSACGPAPSAVDRCVAAMDAARAAPRDATNAGAASIAAACADVYQRPQCRDVHARAGTLPIEAFAVTIVGACAEAYCPVLDPRPSMCSAAELRVERLPLDWSELRAAIWRHDLSAADADRLLAETQRGR